MSHTTLATAIRRCHEVLAGRRIVYDDRVDIWVRGRGSWAAFAMA